jgi:hypothetical protein
MKANLNTNLFPIINVGMYDSCISPENVFDSYNIDDDFENDFSEYNAEQFWDNFDYNKYKAKIQELASDFLMYEIDDENGNEIKIEAGELYSPKYYNFDTDNIELIVEFDKVKLLEYIKTDIDNFNVFLKDNYTSYDGFYSFTANNVVLWYDDYQNDENTAIGALLTYLFKDTDYRESFNMYVYENIGFYSDYYTN